MKNIVFALFLTVSGQALADADYLVKKTTGGGFQLPAIARSEACEIFRSKVPGKYKVVVTRSFGNIVSSYTELLSAQNLEDAIQGASAEPVVTTPNNICDAPETTYYAQIPGELGEFVIFNTGGCGGDETDRQGANSTNIKGLVDQFCPWTIDFNLPST